jgi:hypothetical protein
MIINGYEVVTHEALTLPIQLKHPRSKKKRIRKKFAKKHTIHIPDPGCYVADSSKGRRVLICHPSTYYKLEMLAKEAEFQKAGLIGDENK